MIKTIYILWFQGFQNAPNVIKKCVDSWKYYNIDWKIVLLDNTNLYNYVEIDNYINKQILPCHLSDIIRSILLCKYGGVWADATTFCNKPLNDWLPEYIHEGFFAFNKPASDRLLSNYFLYSEKDGYIMSKWCNSTLNYYNTHNKAQTYFIHHYLFEYLYNSDYIFQEKWNNVPIIFTNGPIGPNYLQNYGFLKPITNEIKQNINKKVCPLYKLSYKCKFPQYDNTNIIYYLYSTLNPLYLLCSNIKHNLI